MNEFDWELHDTEQPDGSGLSAFSVKSVALSLEREKQESLKHKEFLSLTQKKIKSFFFSLFFKENTNKSAKNRKGKQSGLSCNVLNDGVRLWG